MAKFAVKAGSRAETLRTQVASVVGLICAGIYPVVVVPLQIAYGGAERPVWQCETLYVAGYCRGLHDISTSRDAVISSSASMSTR